jgi:D-cysteine desulfhydrase
MPVSFEQWPRFSLLEGSTPIERLTRLEQALGFDDCPPIYVKRDDLMGIGGGGNKLRKLEFLLGEALAQGCDTFITTGARQSSRAPECCGVGPRGARERTVLTDVVARLAIAQERAVQLSAAGRRAYVVGPGGSSPLGCLGYAACAAEIISHERALGLRFSLIVVPNGSSGTHAGLAAGMMAAGDKPSRVQSFAVLAPIDVAAATTVRLANDTVALLDPARSLDEGNIVVSGDQLGEGYGVPTAGMFEAVRLLARS